MPKKKQKKNTPAKAILAVAGVFVAGSIFGTALSNSADSDTSETTDETTQLPSAEIEEITYNEETYKPDETKSIETLLAPEMDESDAENVTITVLETESAPDPIVESEATFSEEPTWDWGEWDTVSDTIPQEDFITYDEPIVEKIEEDWMEPEVPEPKIIEPDPEEEDWMKPELEYTEASASTDISWNLETATEPEQILQLVSVTSPVGRNDTATLTAIGKPYTEYSISVYYATTASSAAGLEDKTSDESGNISWSWKIGSRTNSGDHRIVVTGGGEQMETYFTTTE